MKNYDDEYYLVRRTFNNDRVYVDATKKTAHREYGSEWLAAGEPLFFENSYRERDIKEGIQHVIPYILLEGSDLIVNDIVRDFFKYLDISGLQIYPAVYIDDDLDWHENFWFLNFFESLDCWDRVERGQIFI